MRKSLTAILATEKNYTSATVMAMPEAGFSFKPTDTVWEFRELIHHMVYSIDWMNNAYLENNKTTWDPGPVSGNKSHLVNGMNDAFDKLEQSFSRSTAADETLIPALYFILLHNAHHRGQVTTYLRCNGITPPDYPF
jgi:hypothetical protein